MHQEFRTVRTHSLRLFLALSLLTLIACGDSQWNDPNPPNETGELVYQSVISPAPPKHLDPALSYASDEALFIMQIYEPPLGYHYLKRPYELQPLALQSFPEETFLDAQFNPVDETDPKLAYTRYTLHVRPDEHYQPHPAFAKDEDGNPFYLFETEAEAAGYAQISDFAKTGDRPVYANDFAYAIKRLADPDLASPMLGFMGQYILGMTEFSEKIANIQRDGWLNLDDYDMQGLNVIDQRTLQITIKGLYPQFKYWLAMHFFSPVAPEVDRFYSNPGFEYRNLSLDWWPVGSGPFMMAKNDPNSEIVLVRNPNFREDYYPTEGAPGDREAGFLDDAGKRVPFVDKAVYRLEKEVLPLWTKFLQGYYDRSGEVHSNTNGVFDQAFVVGPDGIEMSSDVSDHGITMSTDVKPSIYYYGFNMRDPVVGGYTEDKRKLRRALQIAFNVEEYLNIFYKGNGIPAPNPIPPGISGHLEGEAGINPYTHTWSNGEAKRRSIEEAKALLAEAGYPNGRDSRTGEPLKIFIDVQSQAISNTSMNWIDRQFAAIGVQVEYRPADWNRTREKLLTGNTQIFSYGWLADYPDPENFLFLLFGPESPLICECDGANNANFEHPEFDELFRKFRVTHPGPERDAMIARMVEIYQQQAVWLYGYYPKEIYLNNAWVHNTKRHGISHNTLKYVRIDQALRSEKRKAWNQPITWPLYTIIAVFIALLLPGIIAYRRRQNATAKSSES